MSFDTFDTDSVSTAGVTFTNGNLTAQGGAGSSLTSSQIAQSSEGKKSGKWYVEFTCNAVSGNIDGVGIVSSWGTIGFIGNTSSAAPSTDCGWAYFTNNHVTNKNTTQTSVNNTTWGAGDVIGIAIDLTNGRVWWRKNTGSWVGTSGTPDPATNTSGFDISHLLTGNCRVYPVANLSGSPAKFTVNFGATSFTGTVPSGFTSGWTNTLATGQFGTFATTGKGSGVVNTPPLNDKAVSKYTANFTGNVGSIIIPFAGGTTSDLKGVIYDNTGVGGLPGALLGISTNTITSGTYGETTFSFSGVSVASGTDYWFGVVSDSIPGTTLNVTLCPPQTLGIAFNSGTYASPTNPFGAAPSTANFRYPTIVIQGSSAETSTGVLTFPGIAFSATATDSHTSTGLLTFSGVSFAGIGHDTTAQGILAFGGISFAASAVDITSGGVLTFSGISFASLGGIGPSTHGVLAFQGVSFAGLSTVSHVATGAMHFAGISIIASALDFPGAGLGRRSFWTFGA